MLSKGDAGEKTQVLVKEAGGRMTSHKPLFFLGLISSWSQKPNICVHLTVPEALSHPLSY